MNIICYASLNAKNNLFYLKSVSFNSNYYLFYSFPWTIFSLIVSNNFLGLLLIKYFGTHFTSFIVISFFMLPSLFIYRKKIKLYSKIIIFIFIFSISLFVLLINYFSYNNKNYEKNLSFELFQMNNDIKKLNSNDSEKIYKSIIKNIRQSNAEVLIFSENNYKVVVVSRTKERVDKICSELKNCFGFICDVYDLDKLIKTCETIKK